MTAVLYWTTVLFSQNVITNGIATRIGWQVLLKWLVFSLEKTMEFVLESISLEPSPFRWLQWAISEVAKISKMFVLFQKADSKVMFKWRIIYVQFTCAQEYPRKNDLTWSKSVIMWSYDQMQSRDSTKLFKTTALNANLFLVSHSYSNCQKITEKS